MDVWDVYLLPCQLSFPRDFLRISVLPGQLVNSTLLVPQLPIGKDDTYFSSMWFDACEEDVKSLGANALES